MKLASIFNLLGVTNGIVNATSADPVIAYRVSIQPLSLSTTAAQAATGFATIFTDTSKLLVGYAGIVSNLEPNLLASTCNATNGCGVHIHSGRSCNSTSTQGGHYFNNASVVIDPWINERYSSDTTGKANFQSVLNIGAVDVEGRVFIVHSKNGTRIGCGIIEKVPVGEKTLLKSSTSNLTMSGVTSQVTVHTVVPDIACYFGMARNLEPNLVSFMNKNQTLMGMNCNFTNGCGVHIHNGTSCFNTTTQGGHFYNRVTYPVDPWLYTMYHATDSVGNAYFTGCAETGESSFSNRPFVVHSNNGTRVSCGLLKGDSRDFFVLINPNNDKQIGELESTVKYTTFPTTFTNIEAKFVNAYKSVRVQFDNPVRRYCDREAPFLIFGDNGRRIPLGPHTVKATPFRGVNCNGSAGKSLIQSFNVVGCNIKYIGRTVPNGTSIFTLEKNGTITYIPTAIPYSAINIEAEVSCGFPIQYIRFEFRNALTKRVLRRQNEDRSPYYVFGDRGGSIGPGFTALPGNYSINIAINGIAHGGTNFTIKS